MTTRVLIRYAVIVAVILGACHPAVNGTRGVAPNDAEIAIPVVTTAMADAWNAADLAGHVRPYADSATFMTPSGPRRGRDVISASLARSFWQDGKPKQRLSFDNVVVRPLGDRHALSTGHFLLTGGGEADKGGWFSLTWEKTVAGWRIVHDHSS